MKRAVLAFAMIATPAFAAAPQPGVPSKSICIDGTSIDSTNVPDDNTVVYKLRNGQVWRNTLKATCNGLAFHHSFAEEIRGGEICANKQIITVIETGIPCQLGDFTLMPRPAPKP